MSENNNIKAIDGLRGMAVMIVVISHYSNFSGFYAPYLGKSAGQLGVILFFTISGFLMCYITDSEPFNAQNILNFWWRRLSRVYPLFAFVVIATYIIGQAHTNVYRIDSENLLAHLFLIQGNGILWTVAIEIAFYFLFPIIWYFRKRSKTYLLFLLFILQINLLYGSTIYQNWPDWIFLQIFRRGHPFIFGIVAYEVYVAMNNIERKYDRAINWLFLVFLFSVPLFYPQVVRTLTNSNYNPWQNYAFGTLAALLLLTSTRSTWANIILGNRYMVFLGTVSYSTYLWHMWPLKFYPLSIPEARTWIAFLGYLAVVALISFVSYRLIELPSRRLLYRLSPFRRK